uniref:Glycoprotein-N-acetylgalactosamine 3-beta-galactosyltransferase 1 n=1 Tax=Glossina pallidipes TaxID=7398 RepID=A0A1A9ZHR5_GLOPL
MTFSITLNLRIPQYLPSASLAAINWYNLTFFQTGASMTRTFSPRGLNYGHFDVLLIKIRMTESNAYFREEINYKVRDDSNFVSKHANTDIANDLLKEVRILCLINTISDNYYKRDVHIKYTWGKRCQKLLFLGLPDHSDFDAINVSDEGSKLKDAFQYIYKHHANDAEWFLLTDDNTYVVMENLRFLLYPYHAQTITYFFIQPVHLDEGSVTTKGSFVLSKQTLQALVEVAFQLKQQCNLLNNYNNQLKKCLQTINATVGDTYRLPLLSNLNCPYLDLYVDAIEDFQI